MCGELTCCLALTSTAPSRYQVSVAGGREPDDRQTYSYCFPTERGPSSPCSRTLSGRTATGRQQEVIQGGGRPHPAAGLSAAGLQQETTGGYTGRGPSSPCSRTLSGRTATGDNRRLYRKGAVLALQPHSQRPDCNRRQQEVIQEGGRPHPAAALSAAGLQQQTTGGYTGRGRPHPAAALSAAGLHQQTTGGYTGRGRPHPAAALSAAGLQQEIAGGYTGRGPSSPCSRTLSGRTATADNRRLYREGPSSPCSRTLSGRTATGDSRRLYREGAVLTLQPHSQRPDCNRRQQEVIQGGGRPHPAAALSAAGLQQETTGGYTGRGPSSPCSRTLSGRTATGDNRRLYRKGAVLTLQPHSQRPDCNRRQQEVIQGGGRPRPAAALSAAGLQQETTGGYTGRGPSSPCSRTLSGRTATGDNRRLYREGAVLTLQPHSQRPDCNRRQQEVIQGGGRPHPAAGLSAAGLQQETTGGYTGRGPSSPCSRTLSGRTATGDNRRLYRYSQPASGDNRRVAETLAAWQQITGGFR